MAYFSMVDEKRGKNPSGFRRSGSAPTATISVAEVIKSLLHQLPLDTRVAVLKEINEHINPIPVQRAGEVLDAISRLFAEKSEWKIEDIKKRVADLGISATSKEVYNAIGYLNRQGYVTRVGYGRYMIGGAVIETSDNLGGPGLRNDDEFRTEPNQTNVEPSNETQSSENGNND